MRALVEHYPSFDVGAISRRLRRAGRIWREHEAGIGFAIDGIGFVAFEPSDGGHSLAVRPVDLDAGRIFSAKTVQIAWTACPFGGKRPWLMCPQCQHRIGRVFIINQEFLCRRCGQLSYQSEYEPHWARPLLRAQRIRERWGGLESRPKGMHRQRYDRIRAKVVGLRGLGYRGVRNILERLDPQAP